MISVDGVADIADRLGQSLASGAELLDLAVEHPAASGEVGQHPGPQLLGLLHHGPALGPGLGHQLPRPRAWTASSLGPCLLLGPAAEVGGDRLGLGGAVGGVLFGRVSAAARLVFGLGPQREASASALATSLGGGVVGRAQHPGRLLAQGGRERGLVEDGVGGPVLGLGRQARAAPAHGRPRPAARGPTCSRKARTSAGSNPRRLPCRRCGGRPRRDAGADDVEIVSRRSSGMGESLRRATVA